MGLFRKYKKIEAKPTDEYTMRNPLRREIKNNEEIRQVEDEDEGDDTILFLRDKVFELEQRIARLERKEDLI